MNRTKIEWCATYLPDGTTRPGFTSNPIKFRDAAGKVVWGCVHASPGCTHCGTVHVSFTRAPVPGGES